MGRREGGDNGGAGGLAGLGTLPLTLSHFLLHLNHLKLNRIFHLKELNVTESFHPAILPHGREGPGQVGPGRPVRRGGAGRGAGHGGLPEAGLEGLPPVGQLQVEDESPWHEQTLSTTRRTFVACYEK